MLPKETRGLAQGQNVPQGREKVSDIHGDAWISYLISSLPPELQGSPHRSVIRFSGSHPENPRLVGSEYLLSLISVAFPEGVTIENTGLEKGWCEEKSSQPFPP